MKRTYYLSDNVVAQLENHAKMNNTSKSKVIEVAISLYIAMHQGAKAMETQFKAMMPTDKEKTQGLKKGL